MKKFIFLLLSLLLAIAVFSQNKPEKAFLIYRNDGVINAFLNFEVDSIVYSALDTDSILHNEIVTQEIWTEDSVYRIPLEVIDSVGFIMPPTKYKENVTRLEQNLLEYVLGAEGLILKLNLNTPTIIIPTIGDRLVLLDGCDALPYGFSGIVDNVEHSSTSIDVVCKQAFLEDLFDSYCNVSTVYGGSSDGVPETVRVASCCGRKRGVYAPDDFIFSLGPYKLSGITEISQRIIPGGDLALSGGASCSTEIQPTFKIHTFLIFGPEENDTYFQCSIKGDLRVSNQTSIYGGLSFNHDFDNVVEYFPIPHTAGLVNFYINPGVFIRANATITTTLNSTNYYTFGMAFDYSRKGLNSIRPNVGGRLASSIVDMVGSLDGSLAGGAYLETGFSLLCREISRVCIRGEFGYQFNGNFVLRNSDINNANKESTLYERLKASSVDMGRFINVGLYTSLGNSEASAKWELSDTYLQYDLVPTFSNTKLTKKFGSATSIDAYTELRGNCLFPIRVGYKLFDKDANEVSDHNSYELYSTRASKMKHTFSGLKDGHYKVYPKVNLFEHDILASPSAELDLHFPVTLSDFKVTKSQFKKGAFTHEGNKYDYRFDVSVSATLDEDAEDIADWGYMYQDPFGNPPAKISLKNFGYSYTDTRYAYFRNENPSTCTLYGYVKYVGSDEPIFGEPHDFPLIHNDYIKVFTGNSMASYTEAQCWGSATLNDDPNAIYLVSDECGFFYNLTGVPQNGNAMKQSCNMGSDGLFDATLAGLTEDTQYYYTAFVRVGEDYYYGAPESFKTKKKEVPNPEPIAITGGHYNETVNSSTIECTYEQISSGVECGYYLNGTPTSLGNVSGKQTISLTGLEPNTEYEYNAFVIYQGQTKTGIPNNFKTLSPLPTTGRHYNEALTSATIECLYANVPYGAECGVELIKDTEGAFTPNIIIIPLGYVTGDQIIPLSNLEPDTKYFYQAYIKFHGKTYYNPNPNDEKEFRTLKPLATTGECLSSTSTSAVVNATYANVPEGASCRINYNSKSGALFDQGYKDLGKVSGSHDVLLDNLLPATEYNYYAYIIYEGKSYDGLERSFSTKTPEAWVDEVKNKDNDITCTSIHNIPYGFSNVPEDNFCHIAIYAEGEENYHYDDVENTSKGIYSGFENLLPDTQYCYFAFIGNDQWRSNIVSFNTKTPSASLIDITEIQVRQATILFSMTSVPEKATTHIQLIDENGNELFYVTSVSQTELVLGSLTPSTNYTATLVIEYAGRQWKSNSLQFTTKTPPTPVATTGDYSNVTKNSAIVSCTFENVPEGGVCGVEYTWNGGSTKQASGGSNGTRTISLRGLKPNTKYTYCAYIEANGTTYYGEDKTLITDLPDISGTWNCTEHHVRVNGSTYDTSYSLTLGKDGTVQCSESSEIYSSSWSFSRNGTVTASITDLATQYTNSGKEWKGTVDDIENPTKISGGTYRWNSNQIGYFQGDLVSFEMTR